MRITESIVEDTALEWFGEQSRFARTLTPILSPKERKKGEAIRRLNPAIPGAKRATLQRFRIVQNAIRREMSL